MSKSRGPSQLSQNPRGELNIEHWPLGKLSRSPRNARSHSKSQVAEIAASIRAFGFTNPILAGPTGEVIAGHGRLAAAELIDLKEVPVIVLADLTETQLRELRLADNRIALNAGWDAELLKLELQELDSLNADLNLLGFTDNELARALNRDLTPGLTGEDETPEVMDTVTSRPGDVWSLGEHRVICGDCTDAETVATFLSKDSPTLMVTDPPYGVDYDPAWRHRAGVNKSKRQGKVANDQQADWSAAWKLFPGNIAYVWHGALHAGTVSTSLEGCGFAIRAQIIWAKERIVIGRGDFHWQHEPCWYAVRKKGYWTGDRKQSTLWSISNRFQDAETTHGTQKPVECMRRPILNNSKIGDSVYDPFLGSGTTLIAAETARRRCLGIEIDPAYVDMIVRRWEVFTGAQATLAGNGKTFAKISTERAGTDVKSSRTSKRKT